MAAIAVGELDAPTHMTWQVSGMGITAHTAAWGSAREAGDLLLAQRRAGAPRPCVVAWLGYPAPPWWRTLDDGLALRAVLERDRPGRAVVVGAGYIGLELAEALSAWGVDITVIGRPPAPLPGLDPDMGALIATAMEGYGMEVRMEETVTGFETHTGKVTAVVTDQATIPTELVILGLGVTPNTTLAADAGIPLGETGAIAVDRRLRTGIEGVWAGGDCVEKFHRVSRRHVALPLGTHANKEGRTAGINIGGGYATFPGVLGTAVTKICDIEVGRTGLGEVGNDSEGL